MKTLILKKLTIVSIFVLFAGVYIKAQPNLPYYVHNGLTASGCSVKIEWKVLKPTSGCSVLCASGSALIAAWSTFPITASGCPSACNIYITVTEVGGSPLSTPLSVDINNTTNSAGSSIPCSSSISLDWYPDNTDINPWPK